MIWSLCQERLFIILIAVPPKQGWKELQFAWVLQCRWEKVAVVENGGNINGGEELPQSFWYLIFEKVKYTENAAICK